MLRNTPCDQSGYELDSHDGWQGEATRTHVPNEGTPVEVNVQVTCGQNVNIRESCRSLSTGRSPGVFFGENRHRHEVSLFLEWVWSVCWPVAYEDLDSRS
ncbi:hypothetical protein VTJ04DRAFT_6127 [Mycothermus thermophilus]|uniref:uncharacterized protein n=1 Tax=Humicola insolens TaxID=85995 RepID=UPI003742531D